MTTGMFLRLGSRTSGTEALSPLLVRLEELELEEKYFVGMLTDFVDMLTNWTEDAKP